MDRDETGARRFAGRSTASARYNSELIRASREQCFAEAVARYKAHEPHWVDAGAGDEDRAGGPLPS